MASVNLYAPFPLLTPLPVSYVCQVEAAAYSVHSPIYTDNASLEKDGDAKLRGFFHDRMMDTLVAKGFKVRPHPSTFSSHHKDMNRILVPSIPFIEPPHFLTPPFLRSPRRSWTSAARRA